MSRLSRNYVISLMLAAASLAIYLCFFEKTESASAARVDFEPVVASGATTQWRPNQIAEKKSAADTAIFASPFGAGLAAGTDPASRAAVDTNANPNLLPQHNFKEWPKHSNQ